MKGFNMEIPTEKRLTHQGNSARYPVKMDARALIANISMCLFVGGFERLSQVVGSCTSLLLHIDATAVEISARSSKDEILPAHTQDTFW
jgi:hypothetical protein